VDGWSGGQRTADSGNAAVPAVEPSSRPAVAQLLVSRLGLTPYADALEYQRDVAKRRISGEIPHDVLLLVEHPPVVTLGRASKQRHLLASPEQLAARGIELFEVERGGDVTFHGPGQLVGYPIIDLKQHRRDLHWYLRTLESALIDVLGQFGISAERNPGFTGVWTHGRKIASIGVHARDWVTWHGFALNVSTDLRYFDTIVPCGIEAVTMTSIARELGENAPDMPRVESAVVAAFASAFELDPRGVERASFGRETTVTAPPQTA
jgi:lipoyl(octanoyl) transferase